MKRLKNGDEGTKKIRVGDVNKLNWQSVKIGKCVDVVEGFFGLEEIEGVEIRKVDGKVEFLVKDQSQIVEKEADEKSKKNFSLMDEDEDEDNIVQDESSGLKTVTLEDDEEEFQGFSEPESHEDEENQELQKLEQAETEESDSDVDLDLIEDYKNNLNHSNLGDDSIQNVKVSSGWANLNLNKYFLKVIEESSFAEPTEIQRKSIPPTLEGRDIIGKAITGSGKTLAYGLPVLEALLDQIAESLNSEGPVTLKPVGLIFAPTRELAKQIFEHLSKFLKYLPISNKDTAIVSLTGGLSIDKQERLLEYGSTGIVITTPGRFAELIDRNEKFLSSLKDLKYLVFDEADRLFQFGHFKELEVIVEKLEKQNKRSTWQNLIFSATFDKQLFDLLDKKARKKDEEFDLVKYLNTKLHLHKPLIIDTDQILNKNIHEALIECDNLSRDLFLYYFLILYKGSNIVFTNSIDSVKRLSCYLKLLDLEVYSIHSSMMQKQRMRNLENFVRTKSILVATDVAARGLDIPNIDHVIHYHIPRTSDMYIHRSGRTGRNAEGVSVILCTPKEIGNLRRLRSMVKDEAEDDLKLLPIEVSIVDQLRERSNLAGELAESEIAKSSLSKEDNWASKVALDLEIDDLSDFEDEHLKKTRDKKQKKQINDKSNYNKRSELKHLLKQKLRFGNQKYLSGKVNFADIILGNKGHDSVVGYGKVEVLDIIKKSKNHKDRLVKLQEQKKANEDRIREKKLEKKVRRKEKRDKKKKAQEEKETYDSE